jgi:hypothetical protein
MVQQIHRLLLLARERASRSAPPRRLALALAFARPCEGVGGGG